MRKQLYNFLSNEATITAIVGDRIYPQRVPTSDALPYLVFDIVGREVDYQQDGYNSFNKLSVEISSCGVSIAQCSALADAVFLALQLIQTQIGAIGDKEQVSAVYLLSESDNYFLFDGSEDGVRETTQNYQINYMEA